MSAKSPPDIYSLFENVRQRRTMFLRRKSLLELQTMCHGYAVALSVHGVKEAGRNFSRNFANYLEKRFGWSTSQGWASAIRDHTHSSRQAFDRFFVLLDEFKNQRAQER